MTSNHAPGKKFSVRITTPGEYSSYLEHRGRSEWSYRTAMKHLKDVQTRSWFIRKNCTAKIVEET